MSEELRKAAQAALENLEAVLCDPEGRACIHGSDGDLKIIDEALGGLRTALASQPQQDTAQAEPVAWPTYEAAMADLLFQQARGIMGTENYGQDDALRRAILHVLSAQPQQATDADALRRDNNNLRTVMIAAAEEIHAHWAAHCDAEGYGPVNLMHRLEEGIPSEYGYTAGAFAALKAAQADEIAAAVAFERERCAALCEMWNTSPGSSLAKEIRGGAEAGKPQAEPVAPAGKMTPQRAKFFMQRFKHEEKLLGPNEQATLDFVIAMLDAAAQAEWAWLVESEPDGLWWDGRFVSRGIDPRFFTRDLNEAVRFARREDAEKVAAWSSALKATEHMWIAAQAQQATAQPQQATAAPLTPVKFDHGIGADRYQVVKGSFWWHVRIGDSTANVGKFHTKMAAEDMALKLLTAFRDGAFMQLKAAQPQQAEPDGNVTIRMKCQDCGHIQNVRGIREGGSTYFGSGFDFCDKCEGVPKRIEQTQQAIVGSPVGTEARVCEDIRRRQALGISKYGTTVEESQLPLRDWLNHAYEEALDLAIYLKRAMEELDKNKP